MHIIAKENKVIVVYTPAFKKYPTLFFSAETNEAREVCCGREVEGTFMCIRGFFPASRQHQSRAAIFELVVPLLNLCDAHAIVAKTHWIFRMVSTWLLPSFWQNLMQYCCSSRSVIFAECDARCVYTLTHTLAARDWCCLLAGKKSTYAQEGTLHLPITAHLPCFISFRGKKSRQILFEHRGTGFWWGNLRKRDHLVDPGVDGRMILRWIFRE